MSELWAQVANAIRQVQSSVRWKPGKDVQHLERRIGLGHLPFDATVADYQAIVVAILSDPSADVFVYSWGDTLYPTIVSEHGGRRWEELLS